MKHHKYSVYYRKEVQGPFKCIDNGHCSMQKYYGLDNGTWIFNCLNIIAPFKTTDSLRFQTLLPELYCELWQSNLTVILFNHNSIYLTIIYIYIYIYLIHLNPLD